MPNWRRRFNLKRIKKAKKKTTPQNKSNKTMMQTTSSRRSVQRRSSYSESTAATPKGAYNNKENNGSDSEYDDAPSIAARRIVKASSSKVAKKVMSASELLAKQGFAVPRNDDSTTTTSCYDMQYSSIAPPEQRCPSARTITNRCFTLDESDEASLSSESFRIKNEMNIVYEQSPMDSSYIKSPTKKSASIEDVDSVYNSSPIPSTYINSPSKVSLPDEVNTVYENSLIQSKKTIVPKKQIDAASWLKKTETKAKSSTTKARLAYGASTRANRNVSSSESWYETKYRGGSNKHNRRSSLSAPNNNNRAKKPLALAVKREKQQRHNANAEADVNETRTCLDKRTARLRYAKDFKANVLQHREQNPHYNNGTNHSDKMEGEIYERSENGVSIVIRKRPIFQFEEDRGDYDVVSVNNSTSDMFDTVCIDQSVMHPDMKTKLVKPLSFQAQAAFDEHSTNDDIYRNIAEPLVNTAVKDGKVATLLLFGQTGCGKSYTMSGIEERMANGIFEACGDTIPTNDEGQITMQFVELCGDIKDLLSKSSAKGIKLLDNEDGVCQVLGAKTIDITSPDHLLQKIAQGKSRRATEATDKNGVSSRSHACLQLRFKGGGCLNLLDLAGSERRGDSLYHSQERMKEGAEINASLYALKECVRQRAMNSTRIPFRNHNLTRLLRESFEKDGAKLCVIAAVSPNATDTEHTIETLRFVTSLGGNEGQVKEGQTRTVSLAMEIQDSRRNILSPPKQWDNAELRRFVANKKMDRVVKLTDKHDGKALMKMSVQQMRAQLFEDKDAENAKLLFDLLRLQNDKVSKQLRADRIKLSKARKGQS